MSIYTLTKRRTWLSAAVAAILAGTVWLTAQPSSGPFLAIDSNYTQALYATSNSVGLDEFLVPKILGGVAFAPDGRVWSSECTFLGTKLHPFSSSATTVNGSAVHPEGQVVDLTAGGPLGFNAGGCGLVNHPNGAMYSNSTAGLWKLDATTGLPIGGAVGHPGNALGIAVDPQTNHLVYVGDDCHPSLDQTGTTCTIWDYDPVNDQSQVFARLSRELGVPDAYFSIAFLDGIYFDPTGNFLFAAHRQKNDMNDGSITASNALRIIGRPASLKSSSTPVDDTQNVRFVMMDSEPDGVAFHATAGFVVTLNESLDCLDTTSTPNSLVPSDALTGLCPSGTTDDGGSMTRFDFGAGYANPPTATSTFARGGFRGDLLQVGGDGCIYGTQAPLFANGGTDGTRYFSGDTSPDQSIFQICGGFAPPPGVTASGSVAGTVYKDVNRDSALDGGDSGLGGVTVTLTKSGTGATTTTTTAANGTYKFSGLAAATYTVSSPATANGLALETASPLTAVVASGQDVTDKNFGYVSGKISGFAYIDWNRDGVKDSGDTGLGGVSIDLASGGSKTTGPDGSYSFDDLDAGSYSVTAPLNADGKLRSTPGTLSATLAEGGEVPNLNFGYVPGGLSGFAYVDVNSSGMKDGGEPGIGGVVITLAGGGTRTTASDGSYDFADLNAGTHSVSAPSTAAGYARLTPSPFPVPLSAGQFISNVNFGYVPGGLSGFAYADTNRNGVKDSGEAGLGGVTITLAGYGTQTTAANGSYSFASLTAGSYNVSAPGTAQGLALDTVGALAPSLAAGQFVPDLNFGYVTGSISGFAYVDANSNNTMDGGEARLSNVTISLSLSGIQSVVTTNTAADGSYLFNALIGGNYTDSAPSTAGNLTLRTPSPINLTLPAGFDQPNVNFGYRPAVAYATYTQGGWGATPNGNNPGMILKNNWNTVYGANGVTIGGSPYYLKFTSQAAIEAFLPAGKTPGVLNKSATNPTSSSAGVFAGQVLALRLSMDFSAAGIITAGLSVQKIAPGYALAGYTLTEVMALANQVLAGNTNMLPAGVTVAKLNDLISAINQNYDNGTTNNGVLVP